MNFLKIHILQESSWSKTRNRPTLGDQSLITSSPDTSHCDYFQQAQLIPPCAFCPPRSILRPTGPSSSFSINGTPSTHPPTAHMTIMKQHLHSHPFTLSYFHPRLFIIYYSLLYFSPFLGGLFSTSKSKLHEGERFLFILLYFKQCLLYCRQSIHICGRNSNYIPQQHHWILANSGAITSKIWENTIFSLECDIQPNY